MTHFSGYIAMSLDGRIADASGGVGWLDRFDGLGTDFGYAEFYAGIDALVMGRATYDFVAAHGGDWPYPGKPCYVITSRPLSGAPEGVEAVPPDFAALKARLSERDQTVWIVGGGATQRGALDAGMLDGLRVHVMPVVLGGGAPLFASGTPAGAQLTDHKIWPGGVVELTYSFARN